MELLLVRHAEPTRDEPVVGPADPGLTERGRAQAGQLAGWVAEEAVDAVYSSPARRAIETAEPLAGRLSLPFEVIDGLAEFDRGTSRYVPVEELRATGDPRFAALCRGELTEPHVEPTAFRDRVVEAVERLIASHPCQRVVAVCHGGVVNAYLGHVLGIERPLWFAPAYTSVSKVLAGRDGRRSVGSLNESGHLRVGLVPR